MKAHPHSSIWLPFCICLSLLVPRHTAIGGLPLQDARRDSLDSKMRPKYVPKKDNTFKLLPRFNDKKDTAGFKLIPKHKDDPEFVPYDKEPQLVKKVEPRYPEPARRAGLEGKVIVKMWVDSDGKVQKVRVLKSDAEIFNEPAIEAARQFVFTPAYLNNKPVAVWVSYPIRFRLHDKM